MFGGTHMVAKQLVLSDITEAGVTVPYLGKWL
jgi:hypothetical protein